jgi:hypothetical protein
MNELVDPEDSTGPARPEKLTVDFYEEPDGIAIRKNRGGGPGCFLSLWLIGWTVGCVALIGQAIRDPALGTFAFALPFWASWLLVAGMLVRIMFGKETLLLRRDKALFLRTALIKLSSRSVPREEIQNFRECRSTHTENDARLWGIEMVTLGKPLRFAFRLPDVERAWPIHQLNRYLLATDADIQQKFVQSAATSSSDSTSTGSISSNSISGSSAISAGTLAVCETLDHERTIAEPPTDSNWLLTDESDGLAVWQRGRLNIGSFFGALFLNAFWNGVVSVFVMVLLGVMPNNNPPRGLEWWALFVFLIPFEVIGLGMFAMLIFILLEPFRSTVWRFEDNRIKRQTRWPVYCRTRVWDVLKLDRLELRRSRSDDSRPQRLTEIASSAPFKLAFIAANNVDLCGIENLTEGDARWVARLVLERRAKWFGK